jgi:hypothetical protein
MKPKLYLESTIPSYLIGWISRDLVTAASQEITQEWWRTRLADFEVFVSDVVWEEISAGDPTMAQRRLEAVAPFPLLAPNATARAIVQGLLDAGAVPGKATRDAAHIALAAAHGMDFLLTWNCRHIANAEILRKIQGICSGFGVKCPVLCTPRELMGQNYDYPGPTP